MHMHHCGHIHAEKGLDFGNYRHSTKRIASKLQPGILQLERGADLATYDAQHTLGQRFAGRV